MTRGEFQAAVLSQLIISDPRDIEAMTCAADGLFFEKFSVLDAVSLLRNCEEINPDLPEDRALANMAKIRARHRAKEALLACRKDDRIACDDCKEHWAEIERLSEELNS